MLTLKMTPRIQLGAVILGIVLTQVASAATVTTAWTAGVGTQDDCLALGTEGVGRAGFRPNVSRDRQTVFGWRGEDSIVVRCIADRDLAVIFIYTRQGRDNDWLLKTVQDAYRRLPPPPPPPLPPRP
ncbi:MAG: hypothetical protein Q6J18_01055 [Gloeomargarita sp. DG02_3_bins_56]